MAQGKLKVKNANVPKKSKHQKKNQLGPKKGGKNAIAPKKLQKIKEKKLKVHLQKTIHTSIEIELVEKAGAESLTVVGGHGSKKKKKNTSKK